MSLVQRDTFVCVPTQAHTLLLLLLLVMVVAVMVVVVCMCGEVVLGTEECFYLMFLPHL